MPAGARPAPTLVDTSVAVALSVADHADHEATSEALRGRDLGLAGHAAFETFSVLTRMPPPLRRTPASIAQLLGVSFPHSRFLGADDARALINRLGELRIGGGAVYDALVGAVAVEHGLLLATRDKRAADTYRALEVRFELLS